VENLTHQWGTSASVPNCLTHKFRHTYTTRLLEHGVDVRVVKELLGHEEHQEHRHLYRGHGCLAERRRAATPVVALSTKQAGACLEVLYVENLRSASGS
jgi:integrase